MLTKRQHELLKFIHEHIVHNGYAPSFSDMCVGLQINSRSSVTRLIQQLEERGFLRRLPGQARGMEVLKMPGIKQSWLGTEYPPQLAMEIVRRSDREGVAPDVIITNALRAQFGLN